MAGVKRGTFWEHLDDLRGVLKRVAIGIVVFSVVAFFFKDLLFSVVLAPSGDDFVTYGMLDSVAQYFVSSDDVAVEEMASGFNVKLISTELTGQFSAHIKMSFYAGFLLVLPYLLYELFRFISPALYSRERRYSSRVVVASYFMFMCGVALSYFLIFPLTFRFLGTYEVSELVENHIVLDSYIGTLLMMNLLMGIVFEIPILALLFAKLGFVSAAFMSKFRRQAIVILLVISMVITPTSDVVTLLVVAMPMYLLYELSILLVRLFVRKQSA